LAYFSPKPLTKRLFWSLLELGGGIDWLKTPISNILNNDPKKLSEGIATQPQFNLFSQQIFGYWFFRAKQRGIYGSYL